MKIKFDISPYRPCEEYLSYYTSMPTFEAAWQECGRGDWMLWTAQKLGVDDRTMTRAKALCANTVRHLMKDSRSTDAIDAALRYADGKITREQLDRYDMGTDAAIADITTAGSYAAGSYAAAAYYATGYASYAAASAASAVAASCAAAYTAIATSYAATITAYAAASAATAAINANRLETARICREVLTDEVFKKVRQMEPNRPPKSQPSHLSPN